MARRTCEATGKVCYRRHQEAAKVLGLPHNKGAAPLAQVPQSIYRCTDCQHWHVTSYTPERTRRITRAIKRKQKRK